MKTYLNLFVLIAICLATLFCTGMEGCNTEEEPAVFMSATPSDGSTIQKDATIVAIFDTPPSGVDVNVPDGVTFSPSGTTVTITGGFTPGPLTLVLTWAGGATTLTYTVESDAPIEPEGPSPEEQLAGIYDLIQVDYTHNRAEPFGIFGGHEPPHEPPIVTGTLVMFPGDSFSMKWNFRAAGGGSLARSLNTDKWDASTTTIFLDIEPVRWKQEISYTWQGTTRTVLIIKIRPADDFPLWEPDEYVLVWKRKT